MSIAQVFVTCLDAHAQRQLPEGYQIALWFSRDGISTQLLDPDETRIDTESPQDFATLCEIAQKAAKPSALRSVRNTAR